MSDEQATWESFHGIPNTEAVLVEKAQITCELIHISLDAGIFAARTVKDQMAGSDKNVFSVSTEREVMAETAAVLLRVVHELATKSLTPRARDTFVTVLERIVAENLERQGLPRGDFLKLLGPRSAEYAHYREWVPKLGESAKGTLFWEYGNKVAFRTGLGMSGLFQSILSNLLMHNIYRWNLVSLLSGR